MDLKERITAIHQRGKPRPSGRKDHRRSPERGASAIRKRTHRSLEKEMGESTLEECRRTKKGGKGSGASVGRVVEQSSGAPDARVSSGRV